MTSTLRRAGTWLGFLAVLVAQPEQLAAEPGDVGEQRATRTLQVVGNHLFIAGFGYGVQILDISDPANLKWKGAWSVRQCAAGIYVAGDYAYVALRRAGLAVLNISNPENPVLVSHTPLPGDLHTVHVSGQLAFAADYPAGFRILDVSDPASPVSLGLAAMPQAALSVEVTGNYAFATEPNGWHLFDISNPREPSLVSSNSLPGPVSRIQIRGEHAFLSSGQIGLLVLDIKDPLSPETLDRLHEHGDQLPITYQHENGFRYAGPAMMLQVPAIRAQMDKQHSANFPRTMDEVIANLRRTPLYYDYSRRDFGIPRHITALHVMDTAAFGLHGNRVEWFELADPAQPAGGRNFVAAGKPWDVRGAKNHAFVMDTAANLQVIDFTDPERPVETARFNAKHFASNVLAARETGQPAIALPPLTYSDLPAAVNAPELLEPKRTEDGGFSFVLKGEPGLLYVIEASEDLRMWTPISTNTIPADGLVRLVDPPPTAARHLFYRAIGR